MSLSLKKVDPTVSELLREEKKRQQEGLELIPSENYVSPAVRQALGSELTNKYAEGYPGKRYYGGNEVVDQVENLAIERAKKLFKVPHANVQPYSGSPANLAVHLALCRPGDSILSQHLSCGGHLSMGQEANLSSKFFKAHHYFLTKNGEVDFDEVAKLAKEVQPKIIWCGGTAYTKRFNFSRYAKIAEEVGAYFVADIAHIAGLVVGGAHPSPVNFAHLVTTTTHKTLRGPRGGMILTTRRGLKKDPDLAQKVDRAVFPGLQGGPHENQIAALAVALSEANSKRFQKYAYQVVVNSKALSKILKRNGFRLVGGVTQNHMIWIDLQNRYLDGWQAQLALEVIGLYINRQSVPFDPKPAYYPSGIRLGTAAATTRGMKEAQMRLIGDWVTKTIEITEKMGFVEICHPDREKDQAARKKFKKEIKLQPELNELRKEVRSLCRNFRIP